MIDFSVILNSLACFKSECKRYIGAILKMWNTIKQYINVYLLFSTMVFILKWKISLKLWTFDRNNWQNNPLVYITEREKVIWKQSNFKNNSWFPERRVEMPPYLVKVKVIFHFPFYKQPKYNKKVIINQIKLVGNPYTISNVINIYN